MKQRSFQASFPRLWGTDIESDPKWTPVCNETTRSLWHKNRSYEEYEEFYVSMDKEGLGVQVPTT